MFRAYPFEANSDILNIFPQNFQNVAISYSQNHLKNVYKSAIFMPYFLQIFLVHIYNFQIFLKLGYRAYILFINHLNWSLRLKNKYNVNHVHLKI